MPEANVKSGALLGFKVGLQSTVDTMLSQGTNAHADHGCFYLTKDGSNEHNPVLINLDKILTIAPLTDDHTTVCMDNGAYYAINEKFEDFIKQVPRYIPFVQAIQQMMYSCADILKCNQESIKAAVRAFNKNENLETFLSDMDEKQYSLFINILIRHFENQDN